MIPEESPAGEAQSNREIKRSIQEVQGEARTGEDALETMCGRAVGRHRDSLPWLIMHTAACVVRHRIRNGRENYI